MLPFSESVEGLVLTALRAGRVDMMDGGIEGWMRCGGMFFLLIFSTACHLYHSALDGYRVQLFSPILCRVMKIPCHVLSILLLTHVGV